MDCPQDRGVNSRMRRSSRCLVREEISMVMVPCVLRPRWNPKNVKSYAWLTELFASLTTSRKRVAMNRQSEAMTRCPARALRTKMLKSSAYRTKRCPRRDSSQLLCSATLGTFWKTACGEKTPLRPAMHARSPRDFSLRDTLGVEAHNFLIAFKTSCPAFLFPLFGLRHAQRSGGAIAARIQFAFLGRIINACIHRVSGLLRGCLQWQAIVRIFRSRAAAIARR